MKNIISLILLFLVSTSFHANATNQTVKIWPNLAPGTEDTVNNEQVNEDLEASNTYQPDLTVFLPEHQKKATPAILVIPGGGFTKICMEKEGYKVAKWLNKNGIAAFVLKYRLDRGDALRDTQRAMSFLRKNAKTYHINKDKIGVMGFSAGANLTGNLVMKHNKRENYDAVDAVSSRPDFWIPIYGGYADIYIGRGRYNLPDDISPAFLVHAGDDSRASSLLTVDLYIDLKNKGVPVEMHIYEQGEHGFALETDRGPAVTSTVNSWSKRCLEWLNVQGIL